MSSPLRKPLFFVLLVLVFAWPTVSSGLALAAGLVFGLSLGNPYAAKSKVMTPKLLSYAIIGLGAGMNLTRALSVGVSGFLYTALGITFTLGLGFLLSRILKINQRLSLLVSVGTAICGGSAIASVAPVLHAKQEEISISLGIVFLLNAVALFLFPVLGHALLLTQPQFGLWAALAIHDTSSVVGATLAYGHEALQIGTTVKLARALWIIPVTLLISALWARFGEDQQSSGERLPRRYPWFILGFLLTAAFNTWVPYFSFVSPTLEFLAKRLMVVTLFLIGSHINVALLKGMGKGPIIQGLLLWVIVASLTLVGILYSLIPAA